MKKFFNKSLALMGAVSLMLLALGTLECQATSIASPNTAINVFAVTTTNQQVNPSYAIVGARSGNQGAPVVTGINAGSDLASSVITTYKVTAVATCTFTNSTTTLFVNNTNGFATMSSSVIVIQHFTDDSYEKRILQTSGQSASTNLSVTVAPMGTVVPGDKIYYCITTGAPRIFWGASTNTLSNLGGITVGQPGLPLLMEISITSNGGINTVSGFYAPPVIVPRPGL
jgi:hypothetical protein